MVKNINIFLQDLKLLPPSAASYGVHEITVKTTHELNQHDQKRARTKATILVVDYGQQIMNIMFDIDFDDENRDQDEDNED